MSVNAALPRFILADRKDIRKNYNIKAGGCR
jgi:hypothetical protein